MLFDNTLILADAQAITADAAGAVGGSAKVLELGGDDYSTMWVACLVDTAFTFSGSPTGAKIAVAIETDSASNFSTKTVLQSVDVDVKNLKKGDVVAFRLPLGNKKYTRCYFDITLTGGSSPAVTAGKLTVGLTDGIWAK